MLVDVLLNHRSHVEGETLAVKFFQQSRQHNLRDVEQYINVLREARPSPHNCRQPSHDGVANRLGVERFSEQFNGSN